MKKEAVKKNNIYIYIEKEAMKKINNRK